MDRTWAEGCVRPTLHHRFDKDSGWCVRGCGVRDDGRIVNRGGDVLYEALIGPPDDEPF